MKLIEITKNYLKLFFFKRDEAIYACVKRNITLTEKNINEVREIIKQEKKIAIANSKSL